MLMGGSAAAAQQAKVRSRASATAGGRCVNMRMAFMGLLGCGLNAWLRHWQESCGPGAAPAVELLHRRNTQRLDVVPEHAMESPSFAVVGDECHGIIFCV